MKTNKNREEEQSTSRSKYDCMCWRAVEFTIESFITIIIIYATGWACYGLAIGIEGAEHLALVSYFQWPSTHTGMYFVLTLEWNIANSPNKWVIRKYFDVQFVALYILLYIIMCVHVHW